MEELIEQFLLSYKFCPLPGIGTLKINDTGAKVVSGAKILSAPAMMITLNNDAEDTIAFTKFISEAMGISKSETGDLLNAFISKIKTLELNKEFRIGHIGLFCKSGGKLVFVQAELPHEFLPSVTLNRVIHPNNIHTVRVGEDERTSIFMSEFLERMKISKKTFRWVYAAALTLMAISFIVLYMNSNGSNKLFGNNRPIQIKSEVKNYETIH